MSIYGSDIYNYRDNYILNEAYIGKTPTLEKIEEKLGQFRQNIKYYDDISSSKEIIEINRLFEKQFGMDVFALKILKSENLDAGTYSILTRFDIIEENYDSIRGLITADSSNGYRFKKPNNLGIIVQISYGFLTNKDFTDGEIMAVLLHEIGHNFSGSIYQKLYDTNKTTFYCYKEIIKRQIVMDAILSLCIVGIPYLIKDIQTYNILSNKYQNKAAKKTQKRGLFRKLKGLMSGAKGKFNDFDQFLGELMIRMEGASETKKMIDDAEKNGYDKTQYMKDMGRADEVIADKFAGIYGYGVDQATALMKCDAFKSRAYKRIEAKGSEKDKRNNAQYQEVFAKINFFDVHPQTIQRAYEEIKLLRREAQKEDIDPKVKEILLDQIKQLEDAIDKATTTSKKISKNDNAQRMFNKYIKNEYPDAVTEEIENEIEEALDRVIEEEKKKYNKKR